MLSAGQIDQDRHGTNISSGDGQLLEDVTDQRTFNLFGLKGDWTAELSDRHLLTAGFDLKRLTASYDYTNRDRISNRLIVGRLVPEFETTASNLSPSGNQFGVYLGDRVRLTR